MVTKTRIAAFVTARAARNPPAKARTFNPQIRDLLPYFC
jgi:hypothetical protein